MRECFKDNFLIVMFLVYSDCKIWFGLDILEVVIMFYLPDKDVELSRLCWILR